MIVYFDTSALIPLLVEEPASEAASELWDHADRVVSVRLLYPEARAALAQAQRMQRLSPAQLETAVKQLESLVRQLDHIEVTSELASRAGELAETEALRGYDAAHLAAAETISDADLVVAAADNALRAAARKQGFATATLD